MPSTLALSGPLYKDYLEQSTTDDLLYKGYGQQPPNHLRYECLSNSFDISCRCDDAVPGPSPAFRCIDHDSVSVEMRYVHDSAVITAGMELKANHNPSIGVGFVLDPIINFWGVTGNILLSIGTDVSFDVSTGTFSNYNAGLSINTAFLDASLTLNEKLDILKACCHLELIPLTRTPIAAELKHSFSNNGSIADTIPTTLTFGTQHDLFPSALVKAHINTDGKEAAVVQKSVWQ